MNALKLLFFFPFFLLSHCVTELVSVRIPDVETVTPHAVVGYCILRWLTSTQDVPTELLEGSFVVKWIHCFRAVCLCVSVCVCVRVCVRASEHVCVCVCTSRSVRCKQDLLLPSNHCRQSTAATHNSFFHGLLGMVGCHGNWWDVVHYNSFLLSSQ